jgi:COPII coat assembly protein SEC16
MPDHEDPSSNHRDEAVHSSPPGSPDSLHNGTPLEPPGPHGFDLSVADSGDGASWFAKEDGEHDDGGAWLLSSDQSGGLQQGVEAEADQQHVAPPSQPEEQQQQQPASLPDSTKTPSTTHAQHASSMSFARTVSHEISFADDDEGDWNLPRTNTDPFKFMPPNDRTNSFPVVPPMESNSTYLDQPLSSSQALDVLEESEHDSSFESHKDNELLETADYEESHATQSNHVGRPPSGSIGGQVQGFEGEAADARYAEGVPLIPRATQGDDDEPEKHGSDPFADDDDNDDGFFSQTSAANDQSAPPPLERKSTAQVLSAFGQGSLARQDTLETTQEEDEVTPAAPETNNANGTIDAKWQEAFGEGDDDDDFLLDDKAGETKDIDADAFLGSDDEGLLDDAEDTPQQAVPAPSQTIQTPTSTYAPHQAAASPYQPAAPSYGSVPQYGQRPPPSSTPEPVRAQSFADKAKGGYSSPYDLPDDIASTVPKPRKRPSTQSLRGPSAASPAPPAYGRSVSAAPGAPPPARGGGWGGRAPPLGGPPPPHHLPPPPPRPPPPRPRGAGRSSSSATATIRSATSASASRVYSTTWTDLRKACTPSPLLKCAEPPVGRTWLDPAM